MSYSALAIANAFLDRAEAAGKKLSNMKLQKLLYFAEGHSCALRNERLIEDLPEAWDYGPVYRSVYDEFKRYGSGAITSPAYGPARYFVADESQLKPVATPPEASVNAFLDAVWNAYKDRSAISLSEMSHVADGPWAKARARRERGSIIRAEDIAEYFQAARASAQAKKEAATA